MQMLYPVTIYFLQKVALMPANCFALNLLDWIISDFLSISYLYLDVLVVAKQAVAQEITEDNQLTIFVIFSSIYLSLGLKKHPKHI